MFRSPRLRGGVPQLLETQPFNAVEPRFGLPTTVAFEAEAAGQAGGEAPHREDDRQVGQKVTETP